jgi:sporulation protein YlmC with PRC-barrel domain
MTLSGKTLSKEIDMKSFLAAAFAATLVLAPAGALAQTSKSDTFVTVQPSDQWLASQFIGQGVSNDAGEVVGDINDLLLDKSGKIVNVVIGVGGFLGIGEKNVAIPYDALAITADGNGKRVIKAPLSRERLHSAPDFRSTEKTTYMRAKEQAAEMGQKALETAADLKEKASRKIEEMRGTESKK